MRMWLAKEKKYGRFSLRKRNRDTAIDKAKKQLALRAQEGRCELTTAKHGG